MPLTYEKDIEEVYLMELMDLQTVAELLGICAKSVRNLVKRGELQAVYQGTGKKGRPSMMITVSSYGRLILKREREEKEV